MRRVAVAMVMVALFVLHTERVEAYPPFVPSAPAATVSNTRLSPGDSFVVDVFGCPGRVTVEFNGSTTSEATGAGGGASFELEAPSAPGRYAIRITCDAGGSSLVFVVVEGGAPALRTGNDQGVIDEIPQVGSSGAADLLAGGTITTIVGLGLFVVARIRRHDVRHPKPVTTP